MGIIDTLWVKISCDNCGISETSSASDKGSGWGGSSWNDLSLFANFDAILIGGGKKEPNVTSAKCKKCNQIAKIDSAYGLDKPSRF